MWGDRTGRGRDGNEGRRAGSQGRGGRVGENRKSEARRDRGSPGHREQGAGQWGAGSRSGRRGRQGGWEDRERPTCSRSACRRSSSRRSACMSSSRRCCSFSCSLRCSRSRRCCCGPRGKWAQRGAETWEVAQILQTYLLRSEGPEGLGLWQGAQARIKQWPVWAKRGYLSCSHADKKQTLRQEAPCPVH